MLPALPPASGFYVTWITTASATIFLLAYTFYVARLRAGYKKLETKSDLLDQVAALKPRAASLELPHNPPRPRPPFVSFDHRATALWSNLSPDLHTLTQAESRLKTLARELSLLKSGPLGSFWLGHLRTELKTCKRTIRAYQATETTLTNAETQVALLAELAQLEQSYSYRLQVQIKKIEASRLPVFSSTLTDQSQLNAMLQDHTGAKLRTARRQLGRARQLLAEPQKTEETIAESHQLYVQAIRGLNAVELMLASPRITQEASKELRPERFSWWTFDGVVETVASLRQKFSSLEQNLRRVETGLQEWQNLDPV
jgi:hypothetical protein